MERHPTLLHSSKIVVQLVTVMFQVGNFCAKTRCAHVLRSHTYVNLRDIWSL